MDQVELNKMIKENRGVLRQLTDITNRLEKLENPKEEEKCSRQHWIEIKSEKDLIIKKDLIEIPVEQMSEEEIANIKVGGTDPD